MNDRTLFDITGRVALVTGAASGIGLAITEVLGAYGASVTMLDVDAPALEVHAARLRGEGHDVSPCTVDVTDRAALRAAVDDTARARGRLDVVFANAGGSTGPGFGASAGRVSGLLEHHTDEAWERILRLNLTSVYVTLQAAARHMKTQGGGRIVVTASVAGLQGEPNVSYGYAATKAGVINLVRQAALELAPHNVLVNAIAPGPFLTNIGGGRVARDPAAQAEFSRMVPLGRMATTAEIKGLALLLASPASSYIPGTVIPVDGGFTAG